MKILVVDDHVLIREAMRAEKMAGLARVVLFRRERLLKLEPRGKGIVATSLHFGNEVHASDAYFDEIPDLDLPKEMLELAKHIIDKMAGKFEPDTFEDRYENALIELIRSKQKGTTFKAKPAQRQANVINLMDALQASVSQRRPRSAAADRSAAATRRGPSATRRKTRTRAKRAS